MRSSRKKMHQAQRKRSKRSWKLRMVQLLIILCCTAAIILFVQWMGDSDNSAMDGVQKPHPVQHVDNGGTSSDHNAAPIDDSANASEDDIENNGDKSSNNKVSRSENVDGKKDGDRVSLTFVGDVMFSDKVEGILKQQGYDYPYEYVRPYIEQADISVANMETPITEVGTAAQAKEYVYRSSPEVLPDFAATGFDLVNLANNHSMDYGQSGLLDTMEQLKQGKIDYVGAGRDAVEAYQFKIIERKGMKIAFLGFSRVVPEASWKAEKDHPGVAATYDYQRPVEAIEKAQEAADLVVVIAHWGVEREDLPVAYQKELAHRFIDAGADLIVGSHPHVLQGFEQYKGKWIAYSLGNFIFTTNSTSKTWETVILQASCSNSETCEIRVVPVLTKFAKPEPLVGDRGNALLSRISSISINAKVEADGTVTVEN